ncbi:MAG: glycosyltransferase [Lachnospiraceae bacterium]|nr:glycosyltransferase [Lachnospiraceae bacterium]
MGRISVANLKKTIYYLKRNGLRDTYLAALERLQEKDKNPWVYQPLSEAEAEAQRQKKWADGFSCKFSIIVPTYKTPAVFLRAMIDSVLEQTYPLFELILADASGDDSVKNEVDKYSDERIVYLPLAENDGISSNTNAGLRIATGDYIGLLDHDDVLTKDALYEMACGIERAFLNGYSAEILYSDEDKCDETGENYYEPHLKIKFNLDLILSNNYFCHFLVMKSSLMKKVGFRKEFDGAQDFDLVLQGIAQLMGNQDWETGVIHVPKVLYHWRCHSGSTAVNPQSKMYAYEAGGRAIESFLTKVKWQAKVQPLKHLGFYTVRYEPDVFSVRKEVGVVGGPVYGKGNKITGAIYCEDGTEPYKGLKKGFSGYMHRAVLWQEAYAVDIRNVKVRKELQGIYEEVTGISYERNLSGHKLSGQSCDWKKISLDFAKKVREQGYIILWDPKQE